MFAVSVFKIDNDVIIQYFYVYYQAEKIKNNNLIPHANNSQYPQRVRQRLF